MQWCELCDANCENCFIMFSILYRYWPELKKGKNQNICTIIIIHILNVYFPCLYGLNRFLNSYFPFDHFDFVPDHNHYPWLGIKSLEVYPLLFTPQQLYHLISSPYYHHYISLHGQTTSICLFSCCSILK